MIELLDVAFEKSRAYLVFPLYDAGTPQTGGRLLCLASSVLGVPRFASTYVGVHIMGTWQAARVSFMCMNRFSRGKLDTFYTPCSFIMSALFACLDLKKYMDNAPGQMSLELVRSYSQQLVLGTCVRTCAAWWMYLLAWWMSNDVPWQAVFRE